MSFLKAFCDYLDFVVGICYELFFGLFVVCTIGAVILYFLVRAWVYHRRGNARVQHLNMLSAYPLLIMLAYFLAVNPVTGHGPAFVLLMAIFVLHHLAVYAPSWWPRLRHAAWVLAHPGHWHPRHP